MSNRLFYAKGSLVMALVMLNLVCFFTPTRALATPAPPVTVTDYSFFVGDLDSNYRPVTRVNGYIRTASVAKCYVSVQYLVDVPEVVYLSRFYGPDGRLVDERTNKGNPRKAGDGSVWTFSTDRINKVWNSVGIWRLDLYLGTNLILVEYFSVGDYLFDVAVTGFRSDAATKVLIDGEEAGSIRSEEKKPSALPYGTHTISVSATLATTSGLNYICDKNSLSVWSAGSCTFEYSMVASRVSVAVICLEFPNFPHKTSPDEIRKKAINDVDRFYKEVSYGMLSITGEVFGWYVMPAPMSDFNVTQWGSPSEDRFRLANLALQVAQQNVVKASSYACRVLVFSGNVSFGGYVWGCALSSLRATIQTETSDWTTFAHELGHLLGLPDLYSYDVARTGKGLTYSSVFVGYWDIMSTTSCQSMCAWSRLSLGWVKQNQVLNISWNSWNVSATISPLELGHGTLVMKIETTNKRQYYLAEVRQEMKHSGRTMPGGVLITYVNETKKGGEDIVRVIDAQPNSSTNIRYELFDATFGLWENRSPVYLASDGSFAVVLLQKIEQNYVITVTTGRVGREALDAHNAILRANSTIQRLQSESRLGRFEEAKSSLRDALQEFGKGRFVGSTRIAEDARALAEKESARALAESNMQVAIGLAVSAVVVTLAVLYSRRRKSVRVNIRS